MIITQIQNIDAMKSKKKNEIYKLKIHRSIISRRKKRANIDWYTYNWNCNFEKWDTTVKKSDLNYMHQFWYKNTDIMLDDENEYKKFIEQNRDRNFILMKYEKKLIKKSK